MVSPTPKSEDHELGCLGTILMIPVILVLRAVFIGIASALFGGCG
jgi:hypothetical protein